MGMPQRLKILIKDILYWILPCGIYELIKTYLDLKIFGYIVTNGRSLFAKNIVYKDLYNGKRCFILCNGPSVNQQNLLPLKDEIVFSVSNGYLHKDYNKIMPLYHCLPQITYGLITERDVVVWFEEMDAMLWRDAELFLNYTEEALIRKNKLFPNRKVNYICMGADFKKNQNKIIDITGIVPGVQSVPIMCLIIAMYMGFKEIYLLGVDHDSVITQRYDYAFGTTVFSGKDTAVSRNGKIKDMCEQFKGFAILWEQYRILKHIAGNNDVNIYNATSGGILEEFPRVNLSNIF